MDDISDAEANNSRRICGISVSHGGVSRPALADEVLGIKRGTGSAGSSPSLSRETPRRSRLGARGLGMADGKKRGLGFGACFLRRGEERCFDAERGIYS